MDHTDYRNTLQPLYIELLKLQRHCQQSGTKVLAIFEGRDAAGKGGAIRRITKHLNPRSCRVVALTKPDERERSQWYFQRYVAHLPAAGELVFFDRSWYNRAGIERVMGFCGAADVEEFLRTVPQFELMLVRAGIRLFKFYFAIDRAVQARRLTKRRNNPLKQWKLTPLDDEAQKRWDAYSVAEAEMFARTATRDAPWIEVNANSKRTARLQVVRHILGQFDYPDKNEALLTTDPSLLRQIDGRDA